MAFGGGLGGTTLFCGLLVGGSCGVGVPAFASACAWPVGPALRRVSDDDGCADWGLWWRVCCARSRSGDRWAAWSMGAPGAGGPRGSFLFWDGLGVGPGSFAGSGRLRFPADTPLEVLKVYVFPLDFAAAREMMEI